MTLLRSLIKNCSTKKHFWLEHKYHKQLAESHIDVGLLLKQANNLEEVIFLERKLNFLSKLKQEEKAFQKDIGNLINSFNSHLKLTCVGDYYHTELIHSFLVSLQSTDEKALLLVNFGEIMNFYDSLYEKDYRFWPAKLRTKFLLGYLYTLDLWMTIQLSFIHAEDVTEKLLIPFYDSRKFLQFIIFNVKHCNRKPRSQQLIERFSQLKSQIRSPYMLIRQLYAAITEQPYDIYFEEIWSETELVQIIHYLAKMSYIEFTSNEDGSEIKANDEQNSSPFFSTTYFHQTINILLINFLNTMRMKFKEAGSAEAQDDLLQSLVNNGVFSRLTDIHEQLEASKFYTDDTEDEKKAVQKLVDNYLKFKLEEAESA